jgi:hypothetical protein
MRLTTGTLNPASFVFFPAHFVPVPAPDWGRVQELYREAFEKAQAVRQPSLIDRLWAVTCN